MRKRFGVVQMMATLLIFLGTSSSLLAAIVPLEWDPNSESDVIGYHVYRSNRSGSGYSRVNSALVIGTTYDDSSAASGTTYFYVVTAINVNGLESNYSNELEVMTEVNLPPVAEDDEVTGPEDAQLLIDVLENDVDPEETPLQVYDSTDGEFGRTSRVGERVRYVPDHNFFGTDSFTYTVRDAGGEEATATVHVTVTPVEDAPENHDDYYSTTEDTSLTIDVLENDADPEGSPLTISWITVPGSGSLETLPDGRMIYWPERQFNGVDSFRYRTSDGTRESEITFVEITVEPVNDLPQVDAGPEQSARTGETVELHGLAVDIEDDTLRYQWTQLSGPRVSIDDDRSLTASFVAPEVTTDQEITLELSADDGEGEGTDTAVIVISPSTHVRAVIVPAGLDDDEGGQARLFVGTALLNSTLDRNDVRLKQANSKGESMDIETIASLAPGEQISFADYELTDSSEISTLAFEGSQAALDGFFMVGSLDLNLLDGVAGDSYEGRRVFFPVARRRDRARTSLFLFNTREQDNDVQLRLFDSTGHEVAVRQLRLSPQGSLSGTAGSLFEVDTIDDGYIQVIAEQPVRGFELLWDGSNVAAYGARPSTFSRTLVIPHFFYGPGLGSTEIRLLNTGDRNVKIQVRGWNDAGDRLPEAELRLHPRQLIFVPVEQLLELGNESVSGYLQLHVEDDLAFAAPVIGNVTFSGNRGHFLSALPITDTDLSRQRFLYLAQSPEDKIFTGLVLLNVREEPSWVEIQIYDREGNESGFKRLQLQPKQRLAHLLTDRELLGEDFQQVGGYIDVRSSSPVIAFVMFGDYAGEFLSAVAGQKIP